jgi:tRNA pseudouridine55 synthase
MAQRGPAGPPVTDGLIVVDKAPGMTSHDVVARCRRIARTRKVGHGGTLDPMATGVLVIGVGRATRLLTYVVGTDKVYRATIRLGQSTITDDAEGTVVSSTPVSLPSEAVRAQLATMTGEVDQIPSTVSAIKINGVRAYKMVREGETVELAARRVTISRIDVFDVRPAGDVLDVDVEVACSSGTYIRAIARDLGVALGVGGHLTALRRTAVGGFTLDEATSLEDLAELAGSGGDPVRLPLAQAIERAMPVRTVDADEAKILSHGGPLPAAGIPGPYGILGPDGAALAVVRESDGRARPEVVLAPA